MDRLKRWFSSKLSTEAGKCQEADAYAGVVEGSGGYVMVSQDIPAYCYLSFTDHYRMSERSKTIDDHNGDPVMIVDYDKDDNVIGVELLDKSTLTYDQEREETR